MLQDASGDVVAAADLGAPAVRPPGVPETVPADAFAARLVWLGSHEAYGGIVVARTFHPHAPIHDVFLSGVGFAGGDGACVPLVTFVDLFTH